MPYQCPRCGKPEPHFAPPCFGEPGFYICEPPEICEEAAKHQEFQDSEHISH